MSNREVDQTSRLPEFIGTREAARVLNYNRDHVTRMCQAGKIPAVKPFGEWRIKKSDIQKLIEEGKG